MSCCLQVRLRAPQRVVVHAERRAAIARDEACGVETVPRVALALQHRQAHQRLDAGQIDPLGVEPVLVVQLHLHQRHSEVSSSLARLLFDLGFALREGRSGCATRIVTVKGMHRRSQYR